MTGLVAKHGKQNEQYDKNVRSQSVQAGDQVLVLLMLEPTDLSSKGLDHTN